MKTTEEPQPQTTKEFDGQGKPHDRAWGPEALLKTRENRRRRQASLAARRQKWIAGNPYFYKQVSRLLRFIVEPGRRVLNVRCQTGSFLKTLSPSHGVGVEMTPEMVAVAESTSPEMEYHCQDPEDLDVDGIFDYVLFNDVSDTTDVLPALKRLRKNCDRHSRVLVYSYNHLWEPILNLADRLGWRMPQAEPNWLSEKDVSSLLEIAGFQVLRTHRSVLIPKWIPLISGIFNRFLCKLPLLDRLAMVYIVVARPEPQPIAPETVGVSVIVPCKNERDNIQPAVERLPELAGWTEIIFCDDQSDDGTADEVRRMQSLYPEKRIRLETGPGICKADNVWTGFRAATGEIIGILDGDLTVMPEELPFFVDSLLSGRVEFANGSRLIYPMQTGAMKWSNYVGNWFFAGLFSFLLGQRIKDSLCGTKVMWRRDWERIEPLIGTWNVKDRWGDYELLLGAGRRHLKIVDIPVHYQERVYGVTKMTNVVKNGWNMLKICLSAAVKLRGC